MNRMPGFPGQPMMAAQQFPGNMPQFAPQPMQRNPGIATFPGQPQGFAGVPPQQRQHPQQWQQPQQQQQQQQMAGERIAVPSAPPSQFVPRQVPNKPATETPRFAGLEMPAPPPTIRMQSPDETSPVPQAAPSRLTMPAPEQLGIGTMQPTTPAASAVTIDWNDVHARLRQMGTISFQLHKMQNGCRVTFVLAARGDGQPRYVETEGASEAEAVLAALQRAEGIASR